MKFLELFVSCIIIWIMNYVLGKQLFECKSNIKKVNLLLTIIMFSILLSIVNELYFDLLYGIVKITLSYVLICIFFKIIFKSSLSHTLVTSLVSYLIIFISEIILVIIISPTLYVFNHNSLAFLKHSITINILNAILSINIVKIAKNKLINLINNNKFINISNLFVVLLLLIIIAFLFFRIPVTKWCFGPDLIITMIIVFCSCMIGLLLLKQKSDIQKTKSMYQQLVEYSNITNNVLEEYRVVTHEHNNQLLIIRSMLENKDKDINDYVDNLLEKRKGIKYKWIGELNHLPLSGLKGLINYKVLEMESLKLNKVISISKEVSKIKLEKLSMSEKDNLYSIIGVYLDNAIQAAKESKEKEINIEIYKEKTEMVIIIANTYNGVIEIDKLDNYGYTTKGKNHGIGLHIVKNIINNETIFNSKTYILDNFFVQEMRIDLKQIKTK